VSGVVCLTVDVEDWYDGMAALGHSVSEPTERASGLDDLRSVLERHGGRSTVTLFTVGNYAPRVRDELLKLAADGHEIASHGPDHGRLPDTTKELVAWLRRGREMLEDLVQVPVSGFRAPRFEVPAAIDLVAYRESIAEAGFTYASDTYTLGERSAVRELPVLMRGKLPVGGGSYQRLLPRWLVDASVRAAAGPAVCYYHSYDFGATLPSARSIRSLAVAQQLLGRRRIGPRFERLFNSYGSRACRNVASEV